MNPIIYTDGWVIFVPYRQLTNELKKVIKWGKRGLFTPCHFSCYVK